MCSPFLQEEIRREIRVSEPLDPKMGPKVLVRIHSIPTMTRYLRKEALFQVKIVWHVKLDRWLVIIVIF